MIKFTSCLPKVGGSLRVLRFLHHDIAEIFVLNTKNSFTIILRRTWCYLQMCRRFFAVLRFVTWNGCWTALHVKLSLCIFIYIFYLVHTRYFCCYSHFYLLSWVRARLYKLHKKGALDSQPQVIKFTSCLPRVGGSLLVLRLPPPLTRVAMI